MLEQERLDVVDIITTAPSHLSLAQLCATHRVAAIIQKPLALELYEAMEIARVAERAGMPMMVHENFRFQKPVREVKGIIDSGVIGAVHYCRVAFRSGHDIYARQPYLKLAERLVLMDNGVHVFDVARFLMGEIEGLSCQMQRVRPDVRGEDMASALVRFASGAMGVVEASWGSFLPEDPFPETLIAVEGDRGSVLLDRHYAIRVRSQETLREFSAEPACPPWGERPWHVVQDSVIETCRHWLEAAAGRSILQTSVQDNIKTLTAVEACYLSAARQGAFVTMREALETAGARPL
jgi:predicted dehydrogenase